MLSQKAEKDHRNEGLKNELGWKQGRKAVSRAAASYARKLKKLFNQTYKT